MKTVELTPEYLRKRYIVDLATVEEIASEVGCSIHNIRKRIKDWDLRRGRVLRTSGKLKPWNTGLTKESDKRLANLALSHAGEGNPMHGKQAWNAGMTTEDPRIAKMVGAMRKGYDKPETRAKMAAAKIGKTGEQSNRWNGGVSKIGPYREHRRTVDGRRMYEHRYVAEKCLGRRLAPAEHVHHVDRDESHNLPANLLVLSEADHATLHGAIYRGECDTRAEQVEWLKKMNIKFEELYEDRICEAA